MKSGKKMNKEFTIAAIYIILSLTVIGSYFYFDLTPDHQEELYMELSAEYLEVEGISDEPLREVSTGLGQNCEEVNFQRTDDRGIVEFEIFVNETTELQFCLEEYSTDSYTLEEVQEISRFNFNEKYYVNIRNLNLSVVE